MRKTDLEFDQLDSIINDHPPVKVTEGFTERVMQAVELQRPWVSLWDRPWVQMAATAIGLSFALWRLLSYIFSAWLAIELAG